MLFLFIFIFNLIVTKFTHFYIAREYNGIPFVQGTVGLLLSEFCFTSLSISMFANLSFYFFNLKWKLVIVMCTF